MLPTVAANSRLCLAMVSPQHSRAFLKFTSLTMDDERCANRHCVWFFDQAQCNHGDGILCDTAECCFFEKNNKDGRLEVHFMLCPELLTTHNTPSCCVSVSDTSTAKGISDAACGHSAKMDKFAGFSDRAPAGIDAFIFVLKMGRFTDLDLAQLSAFRAVAGEGASSHAILIFTHCGTLGSDAFRRPFDKVRVTE